MLLYISLKIYVFLIELYYTFIGVAGFLGNKKAKHFIDGRKNIATYLQKNNIVKCKPIWIHCASAGEFEQALPLIEKIKTNNVNEKILVTFFSPSGYIAHSKNPLIDFVCYLPYDTKKGLQTWFKYVHPKIVIFIKYEFWINTIKAIKQKNIPLVLADAIFFKEQIFFKHYGFLFKNILAYFDYIFVQNESSYKLLHNISINKNVFITGDTRFDRVIQICEKRKSIYQIELFKDKSQLFIAGSIWQDDAKALQKFISYQCDNYKTILVPHQIERHYLNKIITLYPSAVLFSDYKAEIHKEKNILIIDNYGLLSSLYFYADIVYVGGGLNKKGIHNIIEAAVYGKPIVIGRFYQKYFEAVELASLKGIIVANDANELSNVLQNLRDDKKLQKELQNITENFVNKNKGATLNILNQIAHLMQ